MLKSPCLNVFDGNITIVDGKITVLAAKTSPFSMVQPWFNPSFLPFPNLPRSSVKKKDHELSERAAAVLREQVPEVQEMVLQGRGETHEPCGQSAA